MTMDRKIAQMARGRALWIAIFLTTPVTASAADASPGDLLVPEGETWTIDAPLHARDLTVLRTLRTNAPGTWIVAARSVHVGSEGVLEGPRGADGADARGSG